MKRQQCHVLYGAILVLACGLNRSIWQWAFCLQAPPATFVPGVWALPEPPTPLLWSGTPMSTHADVSHSILDEMASRGFLPADESKVLSAGITTVRKLSMMNSEAFHHLGVDVDTARARAIDLQSITEAQRAAAKSAGSAAIR